MKESPDNSAIDQTPPSSAAQAGCRIFVTVGTDLPFDRLVRAVDHWAAENGHQNVFAQIGETAYRPERIEFASFIEPSDFKRRFQEADIIVSHAGMGTILSSLQYQKPLLVMPRIAALGEHRNEHQLATAKHHAALNRVNVARDEDEHIGMLQNLGSLPTKEKIGPYASSALTDTLKRFIEA
jgi:UDP-N-acetylglucosamine transferase subunit ALG13